MKDDNILRNDTRLKIEEARQFLDEIKIAYSKFIENDTVVNFIIVKSNFSAFITASRSITLYLQKQYHDVPGFVEWYSQKQEDMSKDLELNYLNKARVENVHIRNVSLGLVNEISCSASMEIVSQEEANRRKESLKNKPDKIDKVDEVEPCPLPKPSKTIDLFIPGQAVFSGKRIDLGANVNLVRFCERQYNKLTILVNECESKFKTN